jgi:hypothetical protein
MPHLTIKVERDGEGKVLLHPSIKRGAEDEDENEEEDEKKAETVGYHSLKNDKGEYAIACQTTGKVLTAWHSDYEAALEELIVLERAAWGVKRET